MKYLIFAHARTGSSTLSRILNCNPGISLCQEPYQSCQWVERPSYPDILRKEVPRNIEGESDLEFSISRLSRHFNCVKHVYNHLDKNGNEYLLRRSFRVIFLGRKNLLRAAVSSQISRHMEDWGENPEKWKSKFFDTRWDPLDLHAIENWMHSIIQEFSCYRSFMLSENISYYELQYEDLFAENSNFREKRKMIDDLFHFMGLTCEINPIANEKMTNLLDSKTHKLNSSETYRKIPNINEIETRLGANETGWLFK